MPVPRAGSFLFEALVTGIWYLLRVSELFALNIEDVFQKQVAGRIQVAVMVRSSKTDQEYNGEYVMREWTCTKDPSDSCPAHILWDQVAERQAVLKSSLGTNNVGGAPLFVGEDGPRLTQCQVLEAIRAAALHAGEALEFKGHARFGTHSMRVAGALAAFSAGIDENTIRALGRWKSNDAMMRYLRGLPVVKAAVASRAMAQALQIAEGQAPRISNASQN